MYPPGSGGAFPPYGGAPAPGFPPASGGIPPPGGYGGPPGPPGAYPQPGGYGAPPPAGNVLHSEPTIFTRSPLKQLEFG